MNNESSLRWWEEPLWVTWLLTFDPEFSTLSSTLNSLSRQNWLISLIKFWNSSLLLAFLFLFSGDEGSSELLDPTRPTLRTVLDSGSNASPPVTIESNFKPVFQTSTFKWGQRLLTINKKLRDTKNVLEKENLYIYFKFAFSQKLSNCFVRFLSIFQLLCVLLRLIKKSAKRRDIFLPFGLHQLSHSYFGRGGVTKTFTPSTFDLKHLSFFIFSGSESLIKGAFSESQTVRNIYSKIG